MKTPDVIKKGLERCKDDRCICDECEFSDGNVKKWRSLMSDALSYIDQLEKRASLNTLRDAIFDDAVAHGLWDKYKYYPATDCVDFIRDEVIELEYAAMNWRNGYEENSELYPEFCHELADVIIMSLSVAGYLGIDIDAAVRRKMEINKARPWKHGKEE